MAGLPSCSPPCCRGQHSWCRRGRPLCSATVAARLYSRSAPLRSRRDPDYRQADHARVVPWPLLSVRHSASVTGVRPYEPRHTSARAGGGACATALFSEASGLRPHSTLPCSRRAHRYGVHIATCHALAMHRHTCGMRQRCWLPLCTRPFGWRGISMLTCHWLEEARCTSFKVSAVFFTDHIPLSL